MSLSKTVKKRGNSDRCSSEVDCQLAERYGPAPSAASCLFLCHLSRVRCFSVRVCVGLGDFLCFIEDTEKKCVAFLYCGLLCVKKVVIHKL